MSNEEMDIEEPGEAEDSSPSLSPIELQKWLEKIQTREKEFKEGWWKNAEDSEKLYSLGKNDNGQQTNDPNRDPYNILYSNTEVLRPSLYSATPKPDVRSRFPAIDTNPLPTVLDRFLTIVSDPADPGTESLDDAMNETVLSALTCAMGYSRIRYYEDRAFPLAIEAGHYKSLIWGKARKWAKIPWLAFRHELSKDELFAQFEIAEEDYDQYCPPEDSTSGEKSYGTIVYEVWCKKTRKIYFICPDWTPKLLKEEEDVLQLKSFYPTPGLLMFTAKPGEISPVPLYQYYRNQAEELNRVTVRLNRVLSAIKVRGAYHGLLGETMKEILSSDDNENSLIAAAESGFLAQMGGFDKAIWLLPLEKLIAVATQLYQARQSIKQVIYELTGISDIIRGSNVASETATASDLKNKWGTIRLRLMQNSTANYVRDLYRLSVDAATTVIPPEQWKTITQIDLPTEAEKVAGKQQLAYWQQMAQFGVQIPPEQAQPVQQMLAKPSIDEIVGKIKDDQNRLYTVNVQTSSTIDLDTAADKAEVNEFMNGFGQLMAGLQPLQALGPSGVEASKQVMLAIVQRFKFGQNIIESLKAIQPPAPQGQDPAIAMKAEAMKAEAAMNQQLAQIKLSSEQQKAAFETQKAQAEMALEQERMALERLRIRAEMEKIQNDMQASNLKLEAQRAKLAQQKQGQANANV
jgi:hypothetical protein